MARALRMVFMLTNKLNEKSHKISFIVPCYNEENWIAIIISKLLKVLVIFGNHEFRLFIKICKRTKGKISFS